MSASVGHSERSILGADPAADTDRSSLNWIASTPSSEVSLADNRLAHTLLCVVPPLFTE